MFLVQFLQVRIDLKYAELRQGFIGSLCNHELRENDITHPRKVPIRCFFPPGSLLIIAFSGFK